MSDKPKDDIRPEEKTSTPDNKRGWLVVLAAAAAVVVCVIAFVVVPMTAEPEPVVTPAPTTAATAVTPTPAHTVSATPSAKPTPTPAPEILPQLKELYAQNNDLAGWLKIQGTEVDYPVMYTQEENGQFYLYRTFDKQDDPSLQGTLFIDKNCSVDPRGANLLIHGHNMKNGSMFHALIDYMDVEFYLEHMTFEYSTLYENAEYEIVSVFLSQVYKKTDDVFKFYQFYDAETEAEFDDYIKNIKELALYETGITPKFGEELVTLATCEYSQENGRLVVVGRKVADTQ
ncbi:MAG TPA: class B sortase [Clostridiales bacterium]|nr:class B sortase [Clostridiales bacterium]